MPDRYPAEAKQVVELARAGMRIAQVAKRFGMSQATIYNWLKLERIDRGEAPGLSAESHMELAVASRRVPQLETELAVSTKVNKVFLIAIMPTSLYLVIESLTWQGIDVQGACVMLGVYISDNQAWRGRPPSARTLRHTWPARS